jgi:hypothetical protein
VMFEGLIPWSAEAIVLREECPVYPYEEVTRFSL